MRMYKIETHLHTAQSSTCGKVEAKEAVTLLHESGYSAAAVTDHFYKTRFDSYGDIPIAEKISLWKQGYEAAREQGERLGFKIYYGMEIRFTESPNDYLVYGISDELLAESPELFRMTEKEFKAFADRHHLFVAQAHPFREHITPADPKNIHGVEVHNGNPRHDSHNEKALAFGEEHNLILLSGSDFHQTEDCSRGGILSKTLPQNDREFADLLFSGDFELFHEDER
ncbi:MAG: hypothetical protein BGN88_09000 [Clostridiales bacterium 43-6]|nr:MAG: hypothetical protein BGN88_09000 [Clostridiales bacterium 43-6]